MQRATLYFFAASLIFFSQNIFADGYYHEGAYSASNYADNDDSSSNYSSTSYDYPQERHYQSYKPKHHHPEYTEDEPTYTSSHHSSKMPANIDAPGEKVIIINPHVHAWGAYAPDGKLIKSGLATSGSSYCRDLHRPCRTRTGTFRIQSLGDESCYSKRFPLGRGGAPMPYCMFFNGGQGIHGSHELADANLSHGCVRVGVSDARWIRFNFANINTKVIVEPY